MPEETRSVRCPLCEGQGALAPQTIIDRFTNPELRHSLEARIAEIAEICGPEAAQARVVNFQREVHTWNPVPIWRRSPKE